MIHSLLEISMAIKTWGTIGFKQQIGELGYHI
jgi:hypothetical protein